ncbi:hypothetical protein RJG79_00910 [Mycoplasmatota bacterium WC44]
MKKMQFISRDFLVLLIFIIISSMILLFEHYSKQLLLTGLLFIIHLLLCYALPKERRKLFIGLFLGVISVNQMIVDFPPVNKSLGYKKPLFESTETINFEDDYVYPIANNDEYIAIRLLSEYRWKIAIYNSEFKLYDTIKLKDNKIWEGKLVFTEDKILTCHNLESNYFEYYDIKKKELSTYDLGNDLKCKSIFVINDSMYLYSDHTVYQITSVGEIINTISLDILSDIGKITYKNNYIYVETYDNLYVYNTDFQLINSIQSTEYAQIQILNNSIFSRTQNGSNYLYNELGYNKIELHKNLTNLSDYNGYYISTNYNSFKVINNDLKVIHQGIIDYDYPISRDSSMVTLGNSNYFLAYGTVSKLNEISLPNTIYMGTNFYQHYFSYYIVIIPILGLLYNISIPKKDKDKRKNHNKYLSNSEIYKEKTY